MNTKGRAGVDCTAHVVKAYYICYAEQINNFCQLKVTTLSNWTSRAQIDVTLQNGGTGGQWIRGV